MEKTKAKVTTGMRVKLVSVDGEDSVLWCAGRVPVGATGTLYLMPPHSLINPYRMVGIDFDHYKPNNPRFGFGMSQQPGDDLPDWLEPVS